MPPAREKAKLMAQYAPQANSGIYGPYITDFYNNPGSLEEFRKAAKLLHSENKELGFIEKKISLETFMRYLQTLDDKIRADNEMDRVLYRFKHSTQAYWDNFDNLIEGYKIQQNAARAARAETRKARINQLKTAKIDEYLDILDAGYRLYKTLDKPEGRNSYFNYPTDQGLSFSKKKITQSREVEYGKPYTNFKEAFGRRNLPTPDFTKMTLEDITKAVDELTQKFEGVVPPEYATKYPRLYRAATTGKTSKGNNIKGGARKTRRKQRRSRRARKSRRNH